MMFLRWGKRFKHGRGGVRPNLEKALDSFLKGAARGSTLAMVDAGLVFWEMGRKDKAISLYLKAAELGILLDSVIWEFLTCKAKWYLKAAAGGYVRAMYNVALCYSVGEGLPQNRRQARKWMKRAADRGHSKAQFEHGLGLFSEGEMVKAVVYLELATRSGETAAAHVKNVILQQLSAASRDRVMLLADNWRALPSSH
ncbi:hypothetical protein GH714_028493 [Hevea brasiliensis]|uniref:F-box protein n=1 Tax=Hevea brasiliensis TaxID=3981 RepID=A0A6A6LJQ3_HEVBR|nr:hypothetical protein GH714_028493 [Hevea brasiliensis]